jgi:hypothetical protein
MDISEGFNPLDVTIDGKTYDGVEVLVIILLILLIIACVLWIAAHFRP